MNVVGGFRGMRRGVILSLAGFGIMLGIGTTVAAATFVFTSGPDVEQQFKTEDGPTTVSTAAGWHDVPHTNFTVSIPSGQKRLVHVTFTAESQCLMASWCSVRVVSAANGVTSELLPAAGTDFAFDSPNDQWEGHAVSRIIRLSGGSDGITYTIKVQAQIVGPTAGSTFVVDDYLTQVEVSS